MEPSEYCSIACGKAGAPPCLGIVIGQRGPALKQLGGYERGAMKRNGGRNEQSGVKDTVAAVRNEEELQVV